MRVAVVTGASSGIGAELCRQLAARGWHVVGLSRRPAPDAHEHEACDVSSRDSVADVAARVLERHPRIDLLVNNAGHKGPAVFVDADPEELESLVHTNFLGAVWCLNAFLPGLQPGSHLVNMVSVAGTVSYGPYSAAKHGLLAFSRSVAVELAPRGIAVHTINPGFAETPGFPQEGRFPFPLNHLVASPELVVQRTLRAIEFDQREITVPRWYAPAGWAQGLAPGLLARLMPLMSRFNR
jgi:NAD(P)-dependent dehydrogenase (short-subunit alcohol dehydrogenase family)